MGTQIIAPQRFDGYRSVNLGCCDRRMTKKLLYDSDIGTVSQHMRSATMPKDVGTQSPGIYSRRQCPFGND